MATTTTTAATLAETAVPRKAFPLGRVLAWAGLILFLLIILVPFWWVLRTALSTNRELYADPTSWLPVGFTLDNFTALMKPLYARVFLDTVWICCLTAFFTLLVGYPLAYALATMR